MKEYTCGKCGETFQKRKEIREHVKENQNWTNGHKPSHPQGREPISTRYTAQKIEEASK